jgi:hypothetical protein
MYRHNPLGIERNEVVWNEIPLFGFLNLNEIGK